jgi:hypothetical protein
VRRLILLALLVGGCTDVFALAGAPDLAGGTGGNGGMPGPAADGAVLGSDMPSAGGGNDLAVEDNPDLWRGGLPSSCANLSCTPALNEGDVTLSSGTLSGCHAYGRLIIDKSLRATQFSACANSISIGGEIDASGSSGSSPVSGAGIACGGGASGGGHGGVGGDPGACGGGAAYGDTMHPREAGASGGGGGGGAGGGVIELAADMVNLLSLIRADGANGNGIGPAGGGAGGSVLIQTGSIFGAGRIEAFGGDGAGQAGGGGGGRVAIYAGATAAGVSVDVHGGNGARPGAQGTIQRQ